MTHLLDEFVEEVGYEPEDDLNGLPKEWGQVPLGSVSKVIPGNSPPGDTYNETGEGLPLVNGPTEFGPTPFSKTKKTKYTTDPKKECKEGDLIVCVRGNTTGRMNIASTHSAIGRGVAAIRSRIHQRFINYYIHSKEEYLLNKGTGTTYPSISSKDLRRLPIPLLTIEEQKEIVDILDRQFSLMNATEIEIDENMNRAKRLRQSILKHAFNGKLTSENQTEDSAAEPLKSEDTKSERGEQKTLSEVIYDAE